MAPKSKVIPIDRAASYDEFGALDAKIAAFRPVLKRHEQLRDQILAWHADVPAGNSFSATGNAYLLEISPREFKRTIPNMDKVKRYFGLARFMSLCSFGIKHIDDHVPAEDRPLLVSSERTGPRHIKARPISDWDLAA